MKVFIDESEQKARAQAVIENLKPACLCNKIRKGTVLKAIQAGAKTFADVSRRTGVGTGPCGGRRCGSMVRGMLGEPVANCNECRSEEHTSELQSHVNLV